MTEYSVFTAIERVEGRDPTDAYDKWCDQVEHPVIVEEEGAIEGGVSEKLGFTPHEFTWYAQAPNSWTMDMIVESLYNFSNDALRCLAVECLLITDGPDKREPV